ncbi:MAG: hypothetical protein H6733_04595 [Alphaproteobacteria bacterium]|nr:hypothetical protein [Alphaproteobacteria bacterium]
MASRSLLLPVVALAATWAAFAGDQPRVRTVEQPVEAAHLELDVGRLYAGYPATFEVRGGHPGDGVGFAIDTQKPGDGPCPPRFSGMCLGLRDPKFVAEGVIGPDGTARVEVEVPENADGRYAVQALVKHPGAPAASDVVVAPVVPYATDSDGDGLRDGLEWHRGLDPRRADSDGDGLDDRLELRVLKTDPLSPDSDGDGLLDAVEHHELRTDPANPDTDGDGAWDGREVEFGTDPREPDTDADGIPDGVDLHPLSPDRRDPFRIRDEIASDPTSSLPDPEFDEVHQRIVWHSMSGHEMWVAGIDPHTGVFVPRDGKGDLIDVDVSPIAAGKNGPEWALSDKGAQVDYIVDDGGEWVLWHAWETSPHHWAKEQMPGARSVGTTPYGTMVDGDPRPFVSFNRNGREDPISGWREILDGGTYEVLPDWLGTIDARPVSGMRLLTGSAPHGPAGWRQIWLYDLDSKAVDFITDDPAHKFDGFVWRAPEFGGRRVVAAARGLEEDAYTEIAVYLETDDGWELVHEIPMPFGYPYVVSPEPFVYAGHSYVSYLASTGGRNFDNGEASVWIASIDPDVGIVRRVSGGDVGVRKDPESYTGGDRPWVYYSEVTDDRTRIIHRCELGLGRRPAE